MLSAFSIFELKKVPSLSTHELHLYGGSSIQTLIGQFGRDLPAKSLERTEFEKAAIVSSDLNTEWKAYCRLLIKQPKGDISMQLKELLTNDMLIALFPNLHKLATICLSIPISTASEERSFSDMKLIKNSLRHRLTELGLSNLMKIVIESREKLTDGNLDEIVDVWNRTDCCVNSHSDSYLITYAYSHCPCTLSTSMNFNNTISKRGQKVPNLDR